VSVGTRVDAAVESVVVAAYTIPTAEPEADGTLDWDSTTIVVVEAAAGGERGLGYTYCDRAAGGLAESRLRPLVEGRDPLESRRLGRDGARGAERRPAGDRLLRDRGGRLCAVGPDVLQADVTRCGGIGEFLRAAALAKAHGVEFSAHTAPALHAHVCCAVQPFAHLEWFHDHARIESMLFDGALEPEHGELRPDLSRAGNGLELKSQDAERWRAT
jgi:L-alanine-DL-glutamate epimerase-like enolase superfamily enzyme